MAVRGQLRISGRLRRTAAGWRRSDPRAEAGARGLLGRRADCDIRNAGGPAGGAHALDGGGPGAAEGGDGRFIPSDDGRFLYDRIAADADLPRIIERFALSRIAAWVEDDLWREVRALSADRLADRAAMAASIARYESFRAALGLCGRVYDSGACVVARDDFESGLAALREVADMQSNEMRRRGEWQARILNTTMLVFAVLAMPQAAVELSAANDHWQRDVPQQWHVFGGWALATVSLILFIADLCGIWGWNPLRRIMGWIRAIRQWHPLRRLADRIRRRSDR